MDHLLVYFNEGTTQLALHPHFMELEHVFC